MTDNLKPEDRSALMASIHGHDTRPEIVVRKLLHRCGFRFRLHAKGLPGKPDIVFPSKLKAIFVHGCFWHQHKGCRKATIPKTRSEFWAKKLNGNAKRDQNAVKRLKHLGWKVLVLWECQLSKNLEARLISFIVGKNGKSKTIPT